MEDKTFELLERMYSEMTKRFDEQDNKITTINNQLTKIEVDNSNNFKALFDGYKQNSEKLNDLDEKIDSI